MSQPGSNSQPPSHLQGNRPNGTKPVDPLARANGDGIVTPIDGLPHAQPIYWLGTTQDMTFAGNNNNLRILYITLAIIIGILLLWIIIVIFTREDPIKILNEMTDLTKQLAPVSDLPRIRDSFQEAIQAEAVINDHIVI